MGGARHFNRMLGGAANIQEGHGEAVGIGEVVAGGHSGGRCLQGQEDAFIGGLTSHRPVTLTAFRFKDFDGRFLEAFCGFKLK